ncbi:hypothetical protein HAX54_027004 [Datura stramonium]|uniref:BHLH domain-containing protein n=1 Tax=Datura stramonium TaxID=4076 RepID=A0ABS8S8D4_DATST|nr:hypothetical protein [Datura stramonium]
MRPSDLTPNMVELEDHEYAELSTCASASATFCRENDTINVTWPSFDEFAEASSPKQLVMRILLVMENKEEEHETKRSNSSRRSRAAAVHNQSERRRRDRINQRMKALQRLVPNASKTDKASMLDEVIDYLKQLQAQLPAIIPSTTQANTVSPAATNTTTNAAPFTNPYSAFLPQSMDMEFFNNMAALYRQQANQSTQITGSKLNQGETE